MGMVYGKFWCKRWQLGRNEKNEWVGLEWMELEAREADKYFKRFVCLFKNYFIVQ